MPPQSEPARGSCACGEASFTITGEPLVRGYCHCLICQAFGGGERADITVFRAEDVSLDDEASTEFEAHKQPALLLRGACLNCRKPAIERLRIPGMPRLVIVPTGNIDDQTLAPEPALHVFYHRRVRDADDELPKHDGFLKSQIAFGVAVVRALRKGRAGG